MLLAELVYNLFYPWPECIGYSNNVSNLFALYLTIMGILPGGVMLRFVPEAHIKSTEKNVTLYSILYVVFNICKYY